jgi:hypothetical protein
MQHVLVTNRYNFGTVTQHIRCETVPKLYLFVNNTQQDAHHKAPARPNDSLISIQTYSPHEGDDGSVLSKGMQKAYD